MLIAIIYHKIPQFTNHCRHITLRIFDNSIEMLDGDSVIASHKRLRGKKEYSLNVAPFVKTFHKKPGAIRNAKAMDHLDAQIRNVFNTYYKDNPKEFLPILDLIREYSEEVISYAIDALLEREIIPSYDTIWVIIQQQNQMIQPFNVNDQACERNYRVMFRTAAGLVNEMIEAKRDNRQSLLLRQFKKVDLLVLDELGYISFDLSGSELLFQLLATRYETASTLITTNLSFSDWIKVFHDKNLTAAILDRITHHSISLNMNGVSYRRW